MSRTTRLKAEFLLREFSWRKEIKESVLIFLFGGVIQLILWVDFSNFTLTGFALSFVYSGIFWVMLWKGSESMVTLMDTIYSWFEYPVRRFVISLFSITVYTVFVVYFLDFMFDFFYFKKDLKDIFTSTGAPILKTLLINIGINTFMHGRGFLLEWRQAAIDNEKLKTEQVTSQYNSLKNQVNPHFLFNSLNALSSLVYDDQDKAVEFIRKLSQVYRYVLDSKDEEVVSLTDEMSFVKNFIFLQKIRFGDNLKVTTIGKEPNLYVPPLAIQILVENAIKHNVVSEKDPLEITIEFKDDYCIVSNSLKEKKVKDSTGIGLENIQARYQYLTDRQVVIAKQSARFEVTIPLLKLKK